MTKQNVVTFMIAPNAAHGPPHVGHLWYVEHVHYIYNWMKGQNDLWHWDLDLRFNILFDINSKPEYQKSYADLCEWLHFVPDQVDSLMEWGDWKKIMMMQATFMTQFWMQSVRYWHNESLDGDRRLVKMLYWFMHNVLWYVRGTDLYPEKQPDAAARAAYPLHSPLMFYIPLLLDEQGEKIDSKNVRPEYLISQHFDKKSEDVAPLLFRRLGMPRGVRDCYPGRLQLQHAFVDEELRVPLDWACPVVA